MLRPALLVACVTFALWLAPRGVRADDIDLALSRFRISGDKPNCDRVQGEPLYCADQELFERLVSELAVAMAPPVAGPARTLGPRGFQLSLGSTVTSIEGGQAYWERGTEGDQDLIQPIDDPQTAAREDQTDSALGVNSSPPAALAWNHVQVRKGLPFGFEAAALLGQGMQTSMWTFGAALKWAFFEGFRTGLGQLPDVSLQAAISRSVGSSQATIQLYAFDLALSKPFAVAQTWSATPFLGLQWLFADIESGVVDLTPGGPSEVAGEPPPEAAYAACRPLGGHQIKQNPPVTVQCAAGRVGSDFENDVVFDPVSQSRLRMFLGGQMRYHIVTLSLALVFDLTVPDLEARPSEPHIRSEQVAGQVAFMTSVGAIL